MFPEHDQIDPPEEEVEATCPHCGGEREEITDAWGTYWMCDACQSWTIPEEEEVKR